MPTVLTLVQTLHCFSRLFLLSVSSSVGPRQTDKSKKLCHKLSIKSNEWYSVDYHNWFLIFLWRLHFSFKFVGYCFHGNRDKTIWVHGVHLSKGRKMHGFFLYFGDCYVARDRHSHLTDRQGDEMKMWQKTKRDKNVSEVFIRHENVKRSGSLCFK